MIKDYKEFIGLEIHIELLTKYKAFSPALNNSNSKPNTNISEYDLGYPGAKPVLNIEIVKSAYKLAKVLNMDINERVTFDRKNYFYFDLPSGYQLTQFYNPIGQNGYINVNFNGEDKKINIKQIHIEHDTAKQIHDGDDVLLDFNRCGIPLIEIVFEHENINSVELAIKVIKEIRKQVLVLGISNPVLAAGTFRIDVNYSIKKDGSEVMGNRIELKNLNSFNNIELAIDYERKQYLKNIEGNIPIHQTTKRFDETTQTTKLAREKSSSDGYNYFLEGNIHPLILNDSFKNEIDKTWIMNMNIFREKYELTSEQEDFIFSNIYTIEIFKYLCNHFSSTSSYNFISSLIQEVIKSKKFYYYDFSLNKELIDVLKLLSENKIIKIDAKKLLERYFNNESISKDIDSLNNESMISNEDVKIIILDIVNTNDKIKDFIVNRPDRVSGLIMGELMKRTKNKVNPKDSIFLINEVLEDK